MFGASICAWLRLCILSLGCLRLVAAVRYSNHTFAANVTRPANKISHSSDYWLANIKRQGRAAFNLNSTGYPVYRNVLDYGAQGDGISDDTEAINLAISVGSRCGKGCDSATVSPALVYFPPGEYLVSKPIIQLYNTQLVGDALKLPVLKAAPSFVGIAVIDSNPYDDKGNNWYTNQNNFFRQIRNFVIDLTGLPRTVGTGIHWQVAQATSLQNIRFEMHRGGSDNKQQGIFMENGSGGFMTDLVFNGGLYGAFVGNQQFMTRNLTFNHCKTAIFMNWNWLWTLKSVFINDCDIGIDMANGGKSPLVGSLTVQDTVIRNTRVGILTSFSNDTTPVTAGTLVVDNVKFPGSLAAVATSSNVTLIPGNEQVDSWIQGKRYIQGVARNFTLPGRRVQGSLAPPCKPHDLLDARGSVFERSKPQYEHLPVSSFISVKAHGAKGDGKTDDTAAIQAVLDSAAGAPDKVVYFDHGAYLVSRTILVPKNIKITGEMWPTIFAAGAEFEDELSPKPVFQVGKPGDVGAVEMSDLMFATAGPQPGAVIVQWNVHETRQGACGMWDVHMRIGGTAGTKLQSDKCSRNSTAVDPGRRDCLAAGLLLHVTKQASIYLENNWFWVADHELDRPDYEKINIYNGRGVLVESQGPVWMYGTSSEHHQLYNYQLRNARNVYMGVIQTETPYFQAKPNALVPFRAQASLADPTFADCRTDGCRKAWGLRILDSTDVYLYGAGLYSFFEHYEQTCLDTESCQENVLEVQRSKNVWLFGLNTKASTNMVTVSPPPPSAAAVAAAHPDAHSAAAEAQRPRRVVPQADNRNAFCSTLALFQTHPAPPQQQHHHHAHFVAHSRHRSHAPSIIVEIST